MPRLILAATALAFALPAAAQEAVVPGPITSAPATTTVLAATPEDWRTADPEADPAAAEVARAQCARLPGYRARYGEYEPHVLALRAGCARAGYPF